MKIIRATAASGTLYGFCRDILKELSNKYEVIGLSSPGNELRIIENEDNIRTIPVPIDRHISVLKDFVSLIRLVKVFIKEKPTMVHSMTPKAGLLCMMAARLTRVPVRVHTFTGLVFPTAVGFKRKLLMMTDKITCKCATHIIPEGEGVKKDLLNNGITNKPIRVLGYGNIKGVDMVRFSHRDEVMKLSEQIRDNDFFTFIFVGRIVGDKGIMELCDAFSKLSTICKTRLFVVGGYDIDPVPERAKEIMNENPNVICVGRKIGDELLSYYAASDCFISPSYREGFPNTVLEAGAMGLPSIVTNINGSNEIIKEGVNGIIIPPHDAKALFEAMMTIMRDKSLREKLAGNARSMIASRYEQSFVRKCLYDFYDEILLTANL